LKKADTSSSGAKSAASTGGTAGSRSRLPRWAVTLTRLLALLAFVAISVLVISVRDRVQEFAAWGYPGIFLIALLSNATVFLPAPGVAVVFTMGSVFNPLLVGLVAGTGGAIGELSGYLAGFSSQGMVEHSDTYKRILPWVQKYGGWAILVLSAIPNPFFDLAGLAAGVSKIPMLHFLLFCWVGQCIKMTAFAYAGASSVTWLLELMK